MSERLATGKLFKALAAEHFKSARVVFRFGIEAAISVTVMVYLMRQLHLPSFAISAIGTLGFGWYLWGNRKPVPRSGHVLKIAAHSTRQQRIAYRFRRQQQWRDEHREVAAYQTAVAQETETQTQVGYVLGGRA